MPAAPTGWFDTYQRVTAGLGKQCPPGRAGHSTAVGTLAEIESTAAGDVQESGPSRASAPGGDGYQVDGPRGPSQAVGLQLNAKSVRCAAPGRNFPGSP
jgi:hypothetical protein